MRKTNNEKNTTRSVPNKVTLKGNERNITTGNLPYR